MPPTKIFTFGYKHRSTATLPSFPHHEIKVIDARHYIFDNPYNDLKLRHLTGQDAAVKAYFHAIPSVLEGIRKIVDRIGSFSGHVYLGCTGGKHRSVYVGEVLSFFYGCDVEHLDLGKE